MDRTDEAQLAVFLRGVDSKFNITEELVDVVSLKTHTCGDNVFQCYVRCWLQS